MNCRRANEKKICWPAGSKSKSVDGLVRLDSEVPISIDWEAAKAGQYDPAGAAELFTEFGFHGLTNQMRGIGKDRCAGIQASLRSDHHARAAAMAG